MAALSRRALHLSGLMAVGALLSCSEGGTGPQDKGAPAAQSPLVAATAKPVKEAAVVSSQLELSSGARQQRPVFRREGAAWVTAQGGYRAAVGAATATITPTRMVVGQGPVVDRIAGAPLVLRTSAVERAGKRVDRDPLGLAQAAEGMVTLNRGAVRERFGALPEGLEQQWLFASAPAGGGDLVVRVQVSGQSYAGETEAGQHFADAVNGVGLRYGMATWIDGSGRRTAVRPQWDSGAIVLRVPGDVVEVSTWPAVLDPVISTELALDDPGSVNAETQVAVGYGGGYYLVVWSDSRTNDGDLYAVRVAAATGAVVDTAALQLTSSAGLQDQPAVAFNGTSFMVAYRDAANAGDIMGVTVSTAGLAGTSFAITNQADAQQQPALAWDPINQVYLVVWVDDRNNGSKPDILGQRITGTGGSVGGVLDITKANGPQGTPAVASNGTDFLVAWTDSAGSSADINARIVSGSGGALVGSVIVVATGEDEQDNPDVAWGNGSFLVAWEHGTDIKAGRVGPSGTVLDAGGFVVSAAAGEQTLPKVVSDGAEFVVVWQDGRTQVEPVQHDIYSSRVTFSGTALDTAGVAISTQGASELMPAVASAGGGKTLIGYTSGATNGQSKARTLFFLPPPGTACSEGSECEGGFCVDGVCCESACGGGLATDCQACNLVGFEGACKPAPSSYVCRASVGECDVAESCDGAALTCPADGYKANGTACSEDGNPCTADQCAAGACTHPAGNVGLVCRTAAGLCDVAELCDGSATCPSDGYKAQGTECREAAGLCDAPESCSGTSAACPEDQKQPNTHVCRPSAGGCDLPELCSGSSNACPVDAYQPDTTVCRGSAGDCDVAESCTGSAAACPPDGFKASGVECRPAPGECDIAESCTGSAAACPADGFKASTVVCRTAVGLCDAPETCTGSAGACPADAKRPNTFECREAAGDCDVAEKCTGTTNDCPADAFMANTVTCRPAAGDCDLAESCTGTAADCPGDAKRPNTHTCRAAPGACDVEEKCTGTTNDCPTDVFKANTVECRPSAGDCDVAESCTGSSGACPTDAFLPNTVECRASGGDCDLAESCTGNAAVCPADVKRPNTFECREAAGDCDVAETCTGTTNACPVDVLKANNVTCRAEAGDCDLAESCTGTGVHCPEDAKRPNTHTCRAAPGACDVEEKCTGTTDDCPTDVFKANTVECRPSGGDCDVAESCTGSAAACPTDAKLPNTHECRAVAGDCDVAEKCTGTTNTCPADGFKPNTTQCRAAAGVCDVAESCTGTAADCPGDAKQPNTHTCRAAPGDCDVAEKCTGTTDDCPTDVFKADTVECRPSGGACDVAESCTGTGAVCPVDAKRPNTFVCRDAVGECDVSEKCTGTTDTCPTNAYQPNGTGCTTDNNPCTLDQCQGGSCTHSPGNAGAECRAPAGLCDAAETCTGTTTSCPTDAKRPNSYVCRLAATECDVAENCAGGDDCPPDAFKADTTPCTTDNNVCTVDACKFGECKHDPGNAGTVCRPAAANNDCDVEEKCTGTTPDCPADGSKPNNTACTPDNNPCTLDVCLSGTCSHPAGNQGAVCRAAGGACDLEETCTGSSTSCPTDAKRPTSYVCRPKNGDCDVEEKCGGGNDCPAEAYASATVQCRDPSCASGAAILAANCPGNAPTCPAVVNQLCTPYVCSGTACAASCTSSAMCAAGNYCENNVCKPKKANGVACTTGESCTSTHCVDGVCCNVACAGQCEACDATPGTCVPVTGQPHGKRTACLSDGTACGGSCNGTLVTACAYPSDSVQCRAAACANGVATIAAFCANTGSCPAIQTQACAPFQCSGTQCGGDCVVDSNCATGSYCFGGICKLKADPGVACSAANQCKSGYCVDSVCCNSPCSGQCQACNEPNKVGTCSPVTGAPRGTRPSCATDGTLCAGTCNGVLTATCGYPTVQCRGPACSNEVATLAASCDGMGACPPVQTQACVPYKCTGSSCGGNCVVDTDCAGGSFCAAGVCLGKLPLGFGCGEDSHCLSGYCVDGVCCGGGCVGQCEACDNPGQQGTCLPVTGAPHGARPQCTSDGSLCSGTCNGSLSTGCTYPGAQDQCRAPACTNNVATIAAYCAGNGTCPSMQTQVCAPFLCEGTQCAGDCTIDTECAPGHYCSAGVCKLMKEIGQPCGQPNECNSGFCADGYCCNDGCSGQCEACDTQNALGVCSVVLGAPHGGKAACAGAGTCQGQCDGIDATACAFPGLTVECSAASCQDSVQKSSANCDGVGSCQPAVTQSCGNFGCDGTVCKTECASPSDCKEGLVCVATQCVVPEAGPDAGPDVVADAQPDTQPSADAKPDTQDATAALDSPTDAADEQVVGEDAAAVIPADAEDAGGCGCTVPGSRTGAGTLAGLLLAASLAVLRRRRNRRAA